MKIKPAVYIIDFTSDVKPLDGNHSTIECISTDSCGDSNKEHKKEFDSITISSEPSNDNSPDDKHSHYGSGHHAPLS